MFNLLVSTNPWTSGRAVYSASRVLQPEYTDEAVIHQFTSGGVLDLVALARYPALFVEETWNTGSTQWARVGQILGVRASGNDVTIEYVIDQRFRPITQDSLIAIEGNLGILSNPRRGFGELSTTHWAVKDYDLFRALYLAPSRRRLPTAFTLPDPGEIQDDQLSAMMPFSPAFDDVYAAIIRSAERSNMRCNRVDGIWENHSVIQDVISLIDRSRYVVCDCSGRNPNVFYEIGIAHTLGKEVILITQSGDDVPFDLKHLRYIQYSNNAAGRQSLEDALVARIRTPLQPF